MTAKTQQIIPRDGAQQSPWQAGLTEINAHKNIVLSKTYDALIVGAGITGLTAAFLLQQAGKQVVIAEAQSPGFGTTGGTSAHLNTFADTTFPEAESAFGEEGAQLFAKAIADGLAVIKDQAAALKIDCDLEDKPGYLYAEIRMKLNNWTRFMRAR